MNKAFDATARGLRTFVSDVADGFFEITHNGFALVGLAMVFAALALVARPGPAQDRRRATRWAGCSRASRRPKPPTLEPTAIERTTAASPADLPKQQAAVAYWLSKKYRVAAEPLSVLVAEAYELGKRTKLDPTLILAIMAVESSFNPFAQSQVGAQGLMQVMTRVHGDKYESAGGTLTAFDPVTNMRVGVKVLQECIARAGSLEGGLRYYVGAANLDDDGGYAAKVLAEHERLLQVADGRAPPTSPHAATPCASAADALPWQHRPSRPKTALTPAQGGPALDSDCCLKRLRAGVELHSARYATGDRRSTLNTVPRADVEYHWEACRLRPQQAFSRSPGQPLFG